MDETRRGWAGKVGAGSPDLEIVFVTNSFGFRASSCGLASDGQLQSPRAIVLCNIVVRSKSFRHVHRLCF